MNFQEVQAHCENIVKENICTVWKIHDYVKDVFLKKSDTKFLNFLQLF